MRPRRRPFAAIAGLCLIGGASLAWVGAGTEVSRTQPGRLVGRDLPIDAARATDPLDTTAMNSPTLVANPRRRSQLVLVSRVDTPRFGCALQLSDDGGSTWRAGSLPAAPGNHSVSCFAPDAAFGVDGTLYVSFTSGGQVPGQGAVPDAVWVTTSQDGGRSFAAAVGAGGPLAFQVRVAADTKLPRHAVLSWLQADGASTWGLTGTANPVVASHSLDGGESWSSPARVSPQSRSLVVAPSPVAAGGATLVAYLDVGDDRLDYAGAHEGRGGPPYAGSWSVVVARSTDGGDTWSEATLGSVMPAQRFRQLFPPTPSLAVSGKHAYVVFASAAHGDADVSLWASGDGGRRWSAARWVGGAIAGDQYLPSVAVAPAGRVDVVYYDRRADPHGSLNEVSMQSSSDHGRTFSRPARVSDRSFDAGIGYGSDRGMPELGSRLALLASDAGDLAVWADTRAGTPATNHQDLARAVVSVAAPSQWRALLFGAGVVVLLAGACLAAVAWIARRRP